MKRIVSLSFCICCIMTACSSNDTAVPNTDAVSVKQALFGTVGGSPWSDEGNVLDIASNAPDKKFGQSIAVANFRTYAQDILISQTDFFGKGHVYSIWNTPTGLYNTETTELVRTLDQEDSFGYDMVAGNFCTGSFSTQRKGDIAFISMPTAGTEWQGGIGIWGVKGSWRTIREFYSNKPLEVAGTALAVGDVDGDGKDDLVYSSMPLTEDYDYLPTTVSVVSDICHKFSPLNPNAVVSTGDPNSNFGSKLYIQDLDGNGTKEIIVIDNLYREVDSDGASEGAIYFYTFDGTSMTESRPKIVGDVSGAIASLAFSDIDGDGDLDLIVGEPMYKDTKKREGRVRTYTNMGIGAAFDANNIVWSAVSNRSHARFGSSVAVADLNQDGHDDLIVGAPGLRGTTEKSRGYVYVYMGSQDGKVFSHEPFWTYISEVSTTYNDDFGRKIIPAQLNGSGWLDLLVTAPNTYNIDTKKDEGGVKLFYAGGNTCYTADKCMIGDTCYQAGKKESGNRCHVCDPAQNNFEWTDVTCAESGNLCAPNVCQPELGCVAQNLEDGTACGGSACSANTLTQELCQGGTCTEVVSDCGSYRCTTGSAPACLLSCTTNADCYVGVCVSNHCTDITDGRPVLVLGDYPSSVAVNSTFMLDASASYDPDEGDVDITWWATNAQIDLVDVHSTLKVNVTAPATVSEFTVHALITDNEGLSSQTDLVFNATAAKSSDGMVKSPMRNAIIPKSAVIPVSGETDPNTPVAVTLTASDGTQMDASCSTISDTDGSWQCILSDGKTTIPAGDYVITATSTINGVPASYDVNIHLSEDIQTDEDGMIRGGSCSTSIQSPTGGAWFILFAGLFLGIVPLRRRMRQ